MAKRNKNTDVSSQLLAALIATGAAAHQEHVTSLAGTNQEPTPFNEFVADHIQNHAKSASDEDYSNLMSCFGLDIGEGDDLNWSASDESEDISDGIGDDDIEQRLDA